MPVRCASRRSAHVVDDLQARDPAEVSCVASDERQLATDGRCGNPQVVGSNELTISLQMAVDLAILPGNVEGETDDIERSQEGLPLLALGK